MVGMGDMEALVMEVMAGTGDMGQDTGVVIVAMAGMEALDTAAMGAMEAMEALVMGVMAVSVEDYRTAHSMDLNINSLDLGCKTWAISLTHLAGLRSCWT